MLEPQGWGEILPGKGRELRRMLEERNGLATIVEFSSGQSLTVFSVAWGRDYGDYWEHVTALGVPLEQTPNDGDWHFFYMSDVDRVVDPSTGRVLGRQISEPGST